MSELLTVDEAAAALRVTSSWLKRQLAARKVPHIRLGRTAYFTPAQVDEIVSAAAVQPGRVEPESSSRATPAAAPAPITFTARSRAAQRRRTA